jgi:hypothetical protein
MSLVDLKSELLAAAAQLDTADRAALIGLGVWADDIDRFRMCGVERIRLSGTLYEPDPDGVPAIITPVRVDTPLTPESTNPRPYVRGGPIVDLVAWHPAQPESWALRRGVAEWIGCIEPQYLDPDPVRVHRSVLEWLRAGCSGLVLLSEEPADQYRTLSWCRGGIIAADARHSKMLRKTLSRPWPYPKVMAVA